MSSQHPGKVLFQQYLQPNHLSQNKLAKALAVPPRRINEIVLGKRAISADTAVRLGLYFANSASYWMQIQAEYDIALAKDKIGSRLFMIQVLPDNNVIPSQNKTLPTHNQGIPQSTATSGTRIKRHLMR